MTKAADAAPPAPPPQIGTADFFREPQISGAKVSPGGTYLALLVPDGDKTRLDIVETATGKATASYNMGREQFIYRFTWADDQHVVWEFARRGGPLEQVYRIARVAMGTADHSEARELATEQIFAGRVRNRPGTILTLDDGHLYTFDVRSRDVGIAAASPYKHTTFLSDNDGRVRAILGLDGDSLVTAVRGEDGKSWKELRRADMEAPVLEPQSVDMKRNQLLFTGQIDSSTSTLYGYDLTSGRMTPLFHSPQVDIEEVIEDPVTGAPIGVLTMPDYPEYHYLDAAAPGAQLYERMRAAFPNSLIAIGSASTDGRYAVVSVESDRRPVDYYLYSSERNQLRKLMSSRPWLNPSIMAERTAFSMKARDGQILHGYLTLPPGVPDQKLPMIVVVHGGPFGLRDRWGFDGEAQFFAHYGYAVLQVNFRGSGGYGREFERLGYGKWGRSMQDDVADATRWAIQDGVADSKRICIYGASYGGYAALMGVERDPDLYRCAIGYAGAYDLIAEQRFADIADDPALRRLDAHQIGEDEADLRDRSPVTHVDRIKVPLLLIHGEEDQRTPWENLRRLTAALDKAGKPYEKLVKSDEGHGFVLPANVVEAYDRMLAFIGKAIGPGSVPAPR